MVLLSKGVFGYGSGITSALVGGMRVQTSTSGLIEQLAGPLRDMLPPVSA